LSSRRTSKGGAAFSLSLSSPPPALTPPALRLPPNPLTPPTTRIYEHYADYVVKDPFHERDQVIKAARFDAAVEAAVRGEHAAAVAAARAAAAGAGAGGSGSAAAVAVAGSGGGGGAGGGGGLASGLLGSLAAGLAGGSWGFS